MPIKPSPPTATVTNKTVFRRRLNHAYAFFTGKAYVKGADMAESALAWSLCRGLHQTAKNYLPEYGDKFQVHVQTPFDKLNLYTATLTILGEDEPLLHTKFCPTPVEALTNLRIMIMVCESPNADIEQELGELREEEMRNDHDGAEEKNEKGPMRDESLPGDMREDTTHGENDVFLDKDKLAREQWGFTMSHLSGKKARHVS